MPRSLTREQSSLGARPPQPLAHVVERNIETLLERQKEEEQNKSFEGRLADAITRFTGSMIFVYLHLVGFTLWITVNLGWLPFKRFDPSFVILAMFASVEAIFLSTFVLISQNRMQQIADKRADLNLHISLLAEHEVTRLIKLNLAMARHMGLEESEDLELSELAQDVSPEKVLEEIEENERKVAAR